MEKALNLHGKAEFAGARKVLSALKSAGKIRGPVKLTGSPAPAKTKGATRRPKTRKKVAAAHARLTRRSRKPNKKRAPRLSKKQEFLRRMALGRARAKRRRAQAEK